MSECFENKSAGYVRLSPPWVTYYREIKGLFDEDPEISVYFDEDNYCVMLYVNDEAKANALASLLPNFKDFGNVSLRIEVFLPNDKELNPLELNDGFVNAKVFNTAFKDNPCYTGATTIAEGFTNPMTFVEFAPQAIQFFNDDTQSLWGITTLLYEQMARDIFQLNGVFISSELIDEVNPVHTWMK